MLDFMAKNWWVLVLRGIGAVIFGVLTILWPAISLAVLVLMWGVWALVDGVFGVIGAFRRRRGEGFPWWLFITGLAGIAAGVFTFINPAITALALVFLIAAFSIVRGIFEIVAAIRLRKEIKNEWLLVTAGVLSVAFGVIVAIAPGVGALAIVLWIGVIAFAIGLLEIVAGLRLRGSGSATPAPA
jgi:uncharacterized membrane protein HdeD (DUF308 family)